MSFWIFVTVLAGVIWIISIRLFIPVFLLALLSRLPLLQSEMVIPVLGALPAVLTGWPGIILLGFLAALEYGVMDDPDSEALIAPVLDRYAKPLLSTLLVYGAINPTALAILAALAAWPVTLWLCRLRTNVLRPLTSFDPDDSFFAHTIRNGVETALIVLVLGVLLLYPLLLYPLVLVLVAVWFWVDRIRRFLESRHRHTCAHCGNAGVHDAAWCCAVCQTEQPSPQQLSLFGGISRRPADDLASHRLRLLRANRCPHCASRRCDKALLCPICHLPVWTLAVTPRAYLQQADSLALIWSSIAFVLLLIPFSGVLLGIVVHRIQVLRPLRQYLSRHGSILVRLLVQVLAALLFIPALFPGLGWLFILPMLASHGLLRRRFLNEHPDAREPGKNADIPSF